MVFLQQEDRQYLGKEFDVLSNPVKLIVFTAKDECQYCVETQQLVEEVAGISDQVTLEVYDLETDVARQYGIEAAPAIVILRDGDQPKDYSIRYFGIPAGYEFTSLIHDILMIGKGDTGLSAATKQWVNELTEPLHLQVFVTPGCPYCPQAVILAHRLAMESDLIKADMIEATEFPELASKYEVMGVPRTVINEQIHIEGAVPESVMLSKLQQAVVF